jgi:hypothetical protein
MNYKLKNAISNFSFFAPNVSKHLLGMLNAKYNYYLNYYKDKVKSKDKLQFDNDMNYMIKTRDDNFPCIFQYTARHPYENRVYAIFKCMIKNRFDINRERKIFCPCEVMVYLDNGH